MQFRTARRAPHEKRIAVALAALLSCLALTIPAGASAATVVNGDFETGNLTGWTNSSTPESGWFAYSGSKAPISLTEAMEPTPRQIIPPPQGTFAAISDEQGPSTHILYQDVALEPGMTHTLSMIVYYKSEAPIAVPSPDSLTVREGPPVPEEPKEEPNNQQYRVDVMNPAAPVNSVNPSDILATVFRTNNGDPETLLPKTVTADLTPFAGQTVRLRLADVDNEFFMNSGADAISITSVPRNDFQIGRLKLNKKKGTATLPVTLPFQGSVKAVDVRTLKPKGKAAASKRKPARVKKATAKAAAPGKVILKLLPTRSGKETLERAHKLSFKLQLTFTPTGGTAASQSFKGKLKLAAPRH